MKHICTNQKGSLASICNSLDKKLSSDVVHVWNKNGWICCSEISGIFKARNLKKITV